VCNASDFSKPVFFLDLSLCSVFGMQDIRLVLSMAPAVRSLLYLSYPNYGGSFSIVQLLIVGQV
jgi:hypothetical protein